MAMFTRGVLVVTEGSGTEGKRMIGFFVVLRYSERIMLFLPMQLFQLVCGAHENKDTGAKTSVLPLCYAKAEATSV